MKEVYSLLFFCLLFTACSHKYYVVRHAEKAAAGANMSSDVPLSDAGKQRAQTLLSTLQSKKIRRIFSTATIRTRTTAEPLSQNIDVRIESYGPFPDTTFIRQLKSLRTNTLVVGHSNTVDEIVNGLAGFKAIPGDLDESEYDNLFVVRYGKFFPKKITVEKLKY